MKVNASRATARHDEKTLRRISQFKADSASVRKDRPLRRVLAFCTPESDSWSWIVRYMIHILLFTAYRTGYLCSRYTNLRSFSDAARSWSQPTLDEETRSRGSTKAKYVHLNHVPFKTPGYVLRRRQAKVQPKKKGYVAPMASLL